MLAGAFSVFLARRHVHYGWVVVAATFLTMLVTAAAIGAPGVFIAPLREEFGWSTADISAALAVRFILFGLMAPFAAALMNRFGLRAVIFSALALTGIGLVASMRMTELWHLFALWGVGLGLGTGLTALVLGATVATRWFSARRGLVVGLLTASSATGQLLFLPLLAAVSESLGWRTALVIVCVLLAVTALIVVLLMADRPADLSLPVYGESVPAAPAPARAPLLSLITTPIRVLVDAGRTGTFWLLFASFFICGLSTNGLVQTHFVSLCGDYGIAALGAASVLALMGIFDFIGTVASGWLSDHYDSRWLLFWYYGLRGLSLLYLPFTGFSPGALAVFAVFYGLDWIATVPPTVRLTAETFGPEKANVVFGWIFAGHQLGAATAAYGAGVARTTFESYLPAFFAAGVFCLLASALVLGVGRGATSLRPRAA